MKKTKVLSLLLAVFLLLSSLTLPLLAVDAETAERILAYRDTYGKFVTTQQLLDVEGIGEGLLEKLRPYVYVEEIE